MPTDLIILGIFGIFWMSLMFKFTVKLWAYGLIVLVHAIKWLFIIGFLTAFLNTPQMYLWLGWTPVSLLVGADVYSKYSKPKIKNLKEIVVPPKIPPKTPPKNKRVHKRHV